MLEQVPYRKVQFSYMVSQATWLLTVQASEESYNQQLLSVYTINTPRPWLPSFLSNQKQKVKKAQERG